MFNLPYISMVPGTTKTDTSQPGGFIFGSGGNFPHFPRPMKEPTQPSFTDFGRQIPRDFQYSGPDLSTLKLPEFPK